MQDKWRSRRHGHRGYGATGEDHQTKPHAAATARRTGVKPPHTPAAPQPVFTNERFKAYELSYSGGATLVYTAESER